MTGILELARLFIQVDDVGAEAGIVQDGRDDGVHQGKTVPLIAAEGLNRTPIGFFCIGGRVAIHIQSPGFGDGGVGLAGHHDFAAGYHAGGHVQNHGGFIAAGGADAEGIVAQLALGAAPRGHDVYAVDGPHKGHHAGVCRHLQVMRTGAEVVAAGDGYGGGSIFPSQINGQVHAVFTYNHAHGVAAVHQSGGAKLTGNAGPPGGIGAVLLKPVEVERVALNTVRIHAARVRFHQAASNAVCILRRHASCLIQRLFKGKNAGNGNDLLFVEMVIGTGHNTPLLLGFKCERICCVFIMYTPCTFMIRRFHLQVNTNLEKYSDKSKIHE